MKTNELCLFAIPGPFTAQLFAGSHAVLFTEDTLSYRQGRFDYQLRNAQGRRGALFPQLAGADGFSASCSWIWDGTYLQWGGVAFYLLRDYVYPDSASRTVSHSDAVSFSNVPSITWSPDYLVIGRETRTSLNRALEQLHPRCVCILCGTPSWKALLWKADCAKANIPCLWMEETGMLVFKQSPDSRTLL